MYYKILEQVFKENKLNVSENTIDLLDKFIRRELRHGFNKLNPYKFSEFSNVPIDESIKLFLFYTKDNYLFEPQLYIDCPYCNNPYLFYEQYQEYLFCEECNGEFFAESAKKKMYVLFKFNDKIEIPQDKINFSRKDPFNTYQILNEVPDQLKKDYPLSSDNIENEDKGEQQLPTFSQVEEANEVDGVPISDSLDNLMKRIFVKR